jgi:carbon monoxide dehydrogenase subunit G
MQIEKSFVVRAARSAVWDFLCDPYRVARCLPGAAITEKISEREYAGTMTVKIGPVTASYRGKLRFERLDAVAGEAELVAAGQETRGKGGADMRMTSRLVTRSAEETEVTVVSDVNVVGILAQFGRGMIQDVSDQLFQKFSHGLRQELERSGAPASGGAHPAAGTEVPAVAAPAQPVAGDAVLDVGALGAAAAGRAAARMLRRPGFWIGLVAGALLLYWLLR